MRPSEASHLADKRPRQRAATVARKYIYAVASAMAHPADGIGGLNGQRPEFILYRGVACVVSDIHEERVRPERRHLVAHREVLDWLIGQAEAVLPVRFGTIAKSESEVRAMLSRNGADLLGQLRRVAGKVEMGLRVSWDVPNIFEFFVENDGDLRAERDRLFGRRGEPTQEERIELGRMFERLLSEARDAFSDTVEDVLSNCCDEIRRNPPRNEREVMNLACLIDRNRQGEFEARVFEAAQRFDNNYSFDYNGPWAPHSFIELDLELAD